MAKIAFLDIDGVLLTGVDWLRHENGVVLRHMLKINDHKVPTYERYAKFNAGAIALVNRMCELTGCKLVLVSSWRQSEFAPDICRLLNSQGIDAAHWHEFPACPALLTEDGKPDKRADIEAWLAEESPQPEAWVVLDDEAARHGLPDIGISGHDGFTSSPFRVACRVLGCGHQPGGLGAELPEEALQAMHDAGVPEADIGFAWWLEYDRSPRHRSPPGELLRIRRKRDVVSAESRAEFMGRLKSYLDARAGVA